MLVNKDNKNKNLDVLICACSSSEHSLIFQYDEDEHEAYVSIHLSNYRNFWERLIHGIKYIFGYKCKYGDFDEIILGKQHAEKLHEIANFLGKTE